MRVFCPGVCRRARVPTHSRTSRTVFRFVCTPRGPVLPGRCRRRSSPTDGTTTTITTVPCPRADPPRPECRPQSYCCVAPGTGAFPLENKRYLYRGAFRLLRSYFFFFFLYCLFIHFFPNIGSFSTSFRRDLPGFALYLDVHSSYVLFNYGFESILRYVVVANHDCFESLHA